MEKWKITIKNVTKRTLLFEKGIIIMTSGSIGSTCKGSCQSIHHLFHRTVRYKFWSPHEASLHTMEHPAHTLSVTSYYWILLLGFDRKRHLQKDFRLFFFKGWPRCCRMRRIQAIQLVELLCWTEKGRKIRLFMDHSIRGWYGPQITCFILLLVGRYFIQFFPSNAARPTIWLIIQSSHLKKLTKKKKEKKRKRKISLYYFNKCYCGGSGIYHILYRKTTSHWGGSQSLTTGSLLFIYLLR